MIISQKSMKNHLSIDYFRFQLVNYCKYLTLFNSAFHHYLFPCSLPLVKQPSSFSNAETNLNINIIPFTVSCRTKRCMRLQ